MLFQIKICGVTLEEDARHAAACGADAIGLNFFPDSPRCVTVPQAERISRAVPTHVARVGVFVNAAVGIIRDTAEQASLTAVQLHGDEDPQFVQDLLKGWEQPLPVLKAIRWSASEEESLQFCRAWEQQVAVKGLLIDASVPGQFGGTGQTLDWNWLSRCLPDESGAISLAGHPVILAGGLTPENVATAIDLVHPAAVDTASGVELGPGQKDPVAVSRFVESALAAFGKIT